MFSFAIKRKKKWFDLNQPLEEIQGFKYNPKINKEHYLDINNLVIVKPEIISGLIICNFDKKYKKILEVYLKALEDDDSSTSGTLMMALDEIARLRTIIINKYNKVLKKKETEKLLKKLKLIENEVRIKVIDYKLLEEEVKEVELEQGMGR